MRKLPYNDKLCMQTLWLVSQSHCLVYAERLGLCGRLNCRLSYQCSTFTLCHSITGNDGFLTKSLLTKRLHSILGIYISSAILYESLVQIDAVKTMSTHGKINAIS